MSSFISLEAVLEGRFEQPLDELPEDLRRRVERGFRPVSWDNQTPEDRRKRAYHWDCLHDPTIQEEQKRLWRLAMREDELKEEFEKWNKTPAKNVKQRLKKEKRLEKLKTELQEVTDAFWREGGDRREDRRTTKQNESEPTQTRNTPLKILIMRYLKKTNGKDDFLECLEFLLEDAEVDEDGDGRIWYMSFSKKPQTPLISSVRKSFNKYRKEWLSLNQ